MKRVYFDEGVNNIKTGSTIYVSGLYGTNHTFINNKYGIVKNVYVRNESGELMYLADIELLSDKKIYRVNFDFIYKITNDGIENIYQHILTVDNPALYYIHKKNLITACNLLDEVGQSISICKDIRGKSHVIFLSGIN